MRENDELRNLWNSKVLSIHKSLIEFDKEDLFHVSKVKEIFRRIKEK
jgi:hypothetical protein